LLLTNNKILSSNPVTITVLPVDVSSLEDYHDIKDILEVDLENNWWILGSIVLIAIISLFAVLWFMNSRTTVVKEQPISRSTLQQLYDRLMQQLKELENTDTSSRIEVVRIFSESSDSVRSFIDKAKGENTAYLTTGEYMAKQKNRFPNAELETGFFQYLRLADAVKFARYTPSSEETKASFPMLKSLVSTVYQQSNPNT